MHPNEYQRAAMRTAALLAPDELLLNGAMGLCGEAGELIDHIKKHRFQGHALDREYIVKELGDIMWYVAIAAEGVDTDLDCIMEMNIEKLQARYPEGFSADRSINREE